jgi:hypothetical protein
VLANREQVLGGDHPETLISRINLAGAYQAAERVGEAILLLERTFADAERALGDENPHTLTALISLAGAYQEALSGRVSGLSPTTSGSWVLITPRR